MISINGMCLMGTTGTGCLPDLIRATAPVGRQSGNRQDRSGDTFLAEGRTHHDSPRNWKVVRTEVDPTPTYHLFGSGREESIEHAR